VIFHSPYIGIPPFTGVHHTIKKAREVPGFCVCVWPVRWCHT